MTQTDLLSPEQIKQFHEEGYCVVDGLFSPEEIDQIEQFMFDFSESGPTVFDSPGGRYEDSDPRKWQVRAMNPHRFDERAKRWGLNPKVAEVLGTLLGKSPLLAQTMLYYKPPGAVGQGMHQDNFYLQAKPHTCIAAWTAVDAADTDNGCLWVVPGSHLDDILCPEDGGEKWLNYGDSHITKFPRKTKPVPVPVKRGQTLVFGGNLIHGSGPNRTKDRSRKTFIGHYIDEASEEVAKFYHPVLRMDGELATNVGVFSGGGPCGGTWMGGLH